MKQPVRHREVRDRPDRNEQEERDDQIGFSSQVIIGAMCWRRPPADRLPQRADEHADTRVKARLSFT